MALTRIKQMRLSWGVLCGLSRTWLLVPLVVVALEPGLLRATDVNILGGFNLESLPPGADVTLPGPATTYVGLGATARLSSTDTPQTVSLASVSRDGMAGSVLTVAIFDKNQPRVKYVTLRPGSPFLYSFRGIGSISVRAAESSRGPKAPGTRLRVESDKPLQVAR
jgi:hypothetical protein